jgi:hypothetical protein
MWTNGSSAMKHPNSDTEFDTTPVPVPHLVPAKKSVDAQEAIANAVCMECGKPYVDGALMCLGCGLLFKPGHRDSVRMEQKQSQTRAVALEIDGTTIQLPSEQIVVLGRNTDERGMALKQPHIALNDYYAEEHGISRQHARIVCYRNVYYIADMGSKHGTYLNGTRLTNNNLALLHSGDEVRLGSLSLRVRF